MVQSGDIEMIHVDILDAVISLINAPCHRGWCHFRYEDRFVIDDEGNRVRCVDEMWSSEWWRREEEKLTTSSKKIIAIGFATDETTLTSVTGRKLQPVYAFAYNYGHWFRSKESGWMLVGFFPIVRTVAAYANSEAVRKYRRLVHRWQMGQLMESIILRKSGFFANLSDKDGVVSVEWVYPRVPFGVADEPEMKASFVGALISSLCVRPCNVCLVRPVEDTIYQRGVVRHAKSVRHLLPVSSSDSVNPKRRLVLKNQHSLHAEYNPMWDVPGYDPFVHPGCILHQLDSGVFEVILTRTVCWLSMSLGGHALVQEFDRRWGHLCQIPGGKIFSRGVSNLANISMAEHRIMTMGLPFVIHGMNDAAAVVDFEEDTAMSGAILEELAVVYLCWRWLLSSEYFTVDIMEAIQEYGNLLLQLLERTSRHINGPSVGQGDLSVKVHKILHWTMWIALFGSPRNWSSETWESAHKSVKKWKGTVSWKYGHAAGRRVMFLNAVYDCHSEGSNRVTECFENKASSAAAEVRKRMISEIGIEEFPKGWFQSTCPDQDGVRTAKARVERWGPGQFRGKIILSAAFDIECNSSSCIADYESYNVWFDDIRRDKAFIANLTMSTSRKDRLILFICLMKRNWHLICFDMDITRYPNVLFLNESDGEVPRLRLLSGVYSREEAVGVILFWRKLRVTMKNPVGVKYDLKGYYVSAGMFMFYYEELSSRFGEEESVKRHVGRVEWIVSFADRQAVILRRTVMSKTRDDDLRESAGDDFMMRFRKRKTGQLPRTCKAHFATITLNMRKSDESAYHTVVLSKSPCVFHLDGFATVQPDFKSEVLSEEGTHEDFKRYFLMDYILFWD